MLIRITLIIAIIGGLAAGVLNFVQVKEKINTTIAERNKNAEDRDTEHKARTKAEGELKVTKSNLEKTNALLVATTAERNDAIQKADDQNKRADALDESLKKTKAERDAAQNDLAAWISIGIPVDKIKATLASLKEVTEARDAIAMENKVILDEKRRLQEKLNLLTIQDYEVPLPPGLKGKVLVADPRYDFVVLDIGKDQGVIEGGRLLVNRNGKLVAKVEVKSIQADRCIANVMPGWKLGDIMEGDQVLY